MRGLRGLDGLKDLSVPRRLPRFPEGPAWQQPIKDPAKTVNIWWPPPPDFRTPRTSDTEWLPYVALSLIFGVPSVALIRKAPYLGAPPIWGYQKFVDGGRDRASSADFFIYPSALHARGMAIRIQTEQYHNFTTPQTYAFDRGQRSGMLRRYQVVDLYDSDWLWDKSGRAMMFHMRRALAGIERQALPQSVGHLRRSRSAR